MLLNYLIITLRNLRKHITYSVITLSGLAIGLGIFLFFFRVYYWAETADSFHKDVDRIYTVVQVTNEVSGNDRHTAFIPPLLAPALHNDIPEIENVTRIINSDRMVVSYNNEKFFEQKILFVDQNFLSFFSFKIINGDPSSMLKLPNSIILSKSKAEKYFGDSSPIGKVLLLNNKLNVVVTGVVDDISNLNSKSTINFDFLLPIQLSKTYYGTLNNWRINNCTGFVKIKDHAELGLIQKKMSQSFIKYFPDSESSPKRLYLFPFKGLIYNAMHIYKFCGHTSFLAFPIFLIIGIIFLFIVSINFINLSTAKYMDRLKEIGIRKVVGAKRSQLINQFLGESIIIVLLSIPISIVVYEFVSSAFTARSGILINYSIIDNPSTIIILIVTALLTGLTAGIYPALFLSSFTPMQILKGIIKSGKQKYSVRKALVVIQFTIAVLFIVLTFVWKEQTDYLYKVDLGYKRENVLAIPLSGEAKNNYQLMRDKFITLPGIENISSSKELPGRWANIEQVIPESKGGLDAIKMFAYGVDYDFLEVLGLKIKQGRDFLKNRGDQSSFIINQTAAEKLGYDYPVGRQLKVGDKQGAIIAVVENYHFEKNINPDAASVLYLDKEEPNYMLIRISKSNELSNITNYIRKDWSKYVNNVPFDFLTLTDFFDSVHFEESTFITEIIGAFAGVTIFFSCLGLFSLASFVVSKRTKEIGIRKVMGATIWQIFTLVSYDFLQLVILANLIAFPLSYFLAQNLLNFAFILRIPIPLLVFVLTLFTTTIVALLSILLQTYKAAKANPIDSIKYE